LKKIKRRPGIYLLPNLLTTTSLFAAFYSIVASLNNRFEAAVMAIFTGMIADGLDGRIARLTNTETAFGAEYDSLSDMVTFGVAPALMLYHFRLQELGHWGWLSAFVYTACVALRLARFNTQLEHTDKSFFQGLSCTAAAAWVTSCAWFCFQMDWNERWVAFVTAGSVILAAILMVSNVRYFSFKKVDWKGHVPFLYILIMVLLFVGISMNPPAVLVMSFTGYVASGPLQTLWVLRQVKMRRRKVHLVKRKS